MNDPLRFYVDESLLGLGKALSYARKDVTYPSHGRFAHVPLGTDDTVWIPIVASAGLITIIRDRRVLTRWWENEVIVQNRLRLIHIAVRRDLSNWDYLRLLVKHWDRIEEELSRDVPGPWRIAVLETKVDLMSVVPKKPTGPRPM